MRRHWTKPVVLALFLAASLFSFTSPASAVSAGQACSKLGRVTGPVAKLFVCTIEGKKRVWRPVGGAKATRSLPVAIYRRDTTWGLVTVTQTRFAVKTSCIDIPVVVDIRGHVGLGIGLVIGMEDNYENQIAEMKRLMTAEELAIGVRNYTIRVCSEAWVQAYPTGGGLKLQGVKYCDAKIYFWPAFQAPILYSFCG